MTILANEPVPDGYYNRMAAAVAELLPDEIVGTCLGPQCTSSFTYRRADDPLPYFCSSACAGNFGPHRGEWEKEVRRLSVEIELAKRRKVDPELISGLRQLLRATKSILAVRFPDIRDPERHVALIDRA